jgi:hypothetical protein
MARGLSRIAGSDEAFREAGVAVISVTGRGRRREAMIGIVRLLQSALIGRMVTFSHYSNHSSKGVVRLSRKEDRC